MANKKQRAIGDIKRIEWLQEMYREWMEDRTEAYLDELTDNFDEDCCDIDHSEPTLH